MRIQMLLGLLMSIASMAQPQDNFSATCKSQEGETLLYIMETDFNFTVASVSGSLAKQLRDSLGMDDSDQPIHLQFKSWDKCTFNEDALVNCIGDVYFAKGAHASIRLDSVLRSHFPIILEYEAAISIQVNGKTASVKHTFKQYNPSSFMNSVYDLCHVNIPSRSAE